MAIISLPTKFGFTNVSKFILTRASVVSRSRYTGQTQSVIFPYAVWTFSGTLVDYDGNEAAIIRAFLMLLEGIKNSFRLPVPGYVRGGVYSNPFMQSYATASRAVQLIARTGGNGANAVLFKVGDYFTINDELKIVTSDVVANAAGEQFVNFQPPLRAAVADGTSIVFLAPTCLMRAADDDVAGWSLAPPFRHGIKFEAVEAI